MQIPCTRVRFLKYSCFRKLSLIILKITDTKPGIKMFLHRFWGKFSIKKVSKWEQTGAVNANETFERTKNILKQFYATWAIKNFKITLYFFSFLFFFFFLGYLLFFAFEYEILFFYFSFSFFARSRDIELVHFWGMAVHKLHSSPSEAFVHRDILLSYVFFFGLNFFIFTLLFVVKKLQNKNVNGIKVHGNTSGGKYVSLKAGNNLKIFIAFWAFSGTSLSVIIHGRSEKFKEIIFYI